MKLIEVTFVKYHPQFAHDPGDVCELLESDALLLLEKGYVVPTKGVATETATLSAQPENAAITTKSRKK